jgi:putative molybdopterin biosynthesis protein
MPDAATETRATYFDPSELKKRRIRLGLNQAELAELAGISPSFMCKLESGKYGDASPATLSRLADALGCTIADLEWRPTQ